MWVALQLEDDLFLPLDPENLDSINPSIEYNPMPLEGGVVGFHLKGTKILPVVDLQERMGISKKPDKLFITCCSVVFIVEYKSMTKSPKGKSLDLPGMAREILSELGVDVYGHGRTR